MNHSIDPPGHGRTPTPPPEGAPPAADHTVAASPATAAPRVRPGDNPFRSEAVDALDYCPEAARHNRQPSPATDAQPETGNETAGDEQGWEALFERWGELNYRGALVGPKGHGKTTLLLALARRYRAGAVPLARGQRFAALVYRLPHGRRRLPRVWRRRVRADPRLVAIDGYERLGWADRRRLRRRRGPTLVTAHRPTGLPTLAYCQTDAALLGRLIATLSPAVARRLPADELGALHARHGGNVRLALRELYDRAGWGEFEGEGCAAPGQ